MRKSILVGGVVALLCAISIYANQVALANQQTGTLPVVQTGLTSTGLLALIATWIGVSFGYVNLRRSLKLDNEKRTSELITAALAIYDKELHEEMAKRHATLMDRKEQEKVNEMIKERFETLKSNEKLCEEIGKLTQALYSRPGWIFPTISSKDG